VIQKALEVPDSDLRMTLAGGLKGHILEASEHMHANFVLQKCIDVLPQSALDFIVEELEEDAVHASSHMYACRAVQRLLQRCSPNQLQVLISGIMQNIVRLAYDNFGNNVLRHLLDQGGVAEKRRIITAMSSNVVDFARNKASSLVLEKCLLVASFGEHAALLEKERAALIRAILGPIGGGKGSGAEGSNLTTLRAIMLDKFGNYIVQRAMESCRGSERQAMKKQLLAAESELRMSSIGRHILASMRRQYGPQAQQREVTVGAIVGGA